VATLDVLVYPLFLEDFFSSFFLFLSEDSIIWCVGSWTKIMYMHMGLHIRSEKSRFMSWLFYPKIIGSEFSVDVCA
jgi:hypothetical protein